MRKLTCRSTDNYQYESESIDFYYNNNIVFRQLNRKLNRGGKSLYIYDLVGKEEIISSGSFLRGEKWWRKIQKSLLELNYSIDWIEIRDAINKRTVENAKKRHLELSTTQCNLKKDLELAQKRVIYLSKQIRENKIVLNSIKNY